MYFLIRKWIGLYLFDLFKSKSMIKYFNQQK